MAGWAGVSFAEDTPPESAAPGEPSAIPSETPDETQTGSDYKSFYWLQWLAAQLGFKVGESSGTPGAVVAGGADPAQGTSLEEMQRDLTALREQMQQLAATLDLLIGRIMVDLQDENAQLRNEVQRLHARLAAAGIADNAYVPRPGGDLIAQILADAPESLDSVNEAETEGAEATEGAPVPPVEFTYTIIQEWGRSPAVATELGAGASSLKGMVCVVPPGSARDDLEQLGRDLRAEYDAYDNINIEVFDDEASARNYADRQVADPAHRVLSISKYKAGGRDVILIFQNGVPVNVRF